MIDQSTMKKNMRRMGHSVHTTLVVPVVLFFLIFS